MAGLVGAGAAVGAPTEITGRADELRALETFLGRSGTCRTLILSGAPGIGKTVLWEHGVAEAAVRGARVLRSRPAEVEAGYSFAGLADLLADVGEEALAALPAPRRRALEVAVLRRSARGRPPEPHAVAAGLVDVLNGLASHAPLLVAVDDAQWLDDASASALAFAARRTSAQNVALLLGERAGSPNPLGRRLERGTFERIRLGGLSLGAIRHVLVSRLDVTLPRRGLRRLYEITDGNPLFALELGRAFVDRGGLELSDDISLPDDVDDLLGVRLANVSDRIREAVLAVALGGDPEIARVEALVGRQTIDDAVAAGLLTWDGERLRPSHPLLAAVVRDRSRASERRTVHELLADSEPDPVRRELHRALAATAPEARLADGIARAVEVAASRGAVADAGRLAESAVRLTPADEPARPGRVLRLAELLIRLGEPRRATTLLVDELDRLPPGVTRARAHMILADSRFPDVHADVVEAHFEQAVAEAHDASEIRAIALSRLSRFTAVVRVAQIPEAESMAAEAWRMAREAGGEAAFEALFALGWARMLMGRPLDDLGAQFRAISSETFPIARSLERIEAEREFCRGNVAGGLRVLERLMALADERNDVWAHGILRLQLCANQAHAGELESAEALLVDWDESADGGGTSVPEYGRMRALLSYVRGHPEEAAPWAEIAVAGAERQGGEWGRLSGVMIRGAAALCAHDLESAVPDLRSVWEHNQREGIHEPGAFPVAGDLVEALARLGELDEADAVTRRLAQLATEQDHPWGSATAMRCLGLTQLARGADVERAAHTVAEAVERYRSLGTRFDAARTLLALGRAERRLRRRAAARTTLERAAVAFDEIGAPGWSDQARGELERLGGSRRGSADGLTRSERKVVELAAAGASNKEIAASLVVSVHTVEVHLSHAYAKLGVRSRSQLAARLARIP